MGRSLCVLSRRPGSMRVPSMAPSRCETREVMRTVLRRARHADYTVPMPSAFLHLLSIVRARVRQPVLVTQAAPRLVADLVVTLGLPETACFQFDLYQTERLHEELAELGTDADVITAADLWDAPRRFVTVLLPSPPRGD